MRLALAAMIVTVTFALAQEHGHPPQDAEIHHQFYKTWKYPKARDSTGTRKGSCCNLTDCHPTEIKRMGGRWWAKSRDGKSDLQIPEEIMEHNQPDPRESPDGRSHVCVVNRNVICAVLGSAI